MDILMENDCASKKDGEFEDLFLDEVWIECSCDYCIGIVYDLEFIGFDGNND